MPTHRYSADCEAEINAIIELIKEENPRAAERWFSQLEEKCRFLAQFPRAGRVRDDLLPDVYMFPFGSYLIFYDIDDAGIVVLHVVDARRDVRHLAL